MSETAQSTKESIALAWLTLLCTLTVLLVLCIPRRTAAEEITIAAAADLTFVFPDLAARFQNDTSNSVKFSFGSSGNFLSQIQNGGPI